MVRDENRPKWVYYCLQRKCGFDVPVRDPNGNPVPLKDGQGNQKYRNGNPLWQERHLSFQVLIDSPAKGYVCTYVSYDKEVPVVDASGKQAGTKWVPENQDERDALEAMADDPSTKVMREFDYEKSVNPTAAEFKRALEQKNREVEAVKAEVAKKSASYEEQIAKMQAEIEALTKPSQGKK